MNKTNCNILIVAVGGAGCNAANNMINNGLEKVTILVTNTDAQSLENSLCKNQILLGAKNVTKGLGAGSEPKVGIDAAVESIEEFLKHLEDIDMVFFTAGMGGGTGTGATNILAKAAKELGKLVVAVVTTPFIFEGHKRMLAAEKGIEELKQNVDTIIIIPNENLFKMAGLSFTFKECFKRSDQVLYQTVKGITELITKPGLINLDFADVRSVMKDKGYAKVGFGNNIKPHELQDDKGIIEFIGIEEMINNAMNHPLLSDNLDINTAKAIMLHVTVGNSLTLEEVDLIAKKINCQIHNKDVHFLFGATFDDHMNEREIQIFVLTTGLEILDVSNKPINHLLNTFNDKSKTLNENTNNHLFENENFNQDDNVDDKILSEEIIEVKETSWFSIFRRKKSSPIKKEIVKNNISDLFDE
jgi:cell division protein FtsZ